MYHPLFRYQAITLCSYIPRGTIKCWLTLLLFNCFVSIFGNAIAADHADHQHSAKSSDQSVEMAIVADIQQSPQYACPMHPFEVSHEPGRCSVCGMFLVKQPNNEAMEHSLHEHEPQTALYVCPMHPQETSHEPGRCSQCGMFLVRQQAAESTSEHDSDIPHQEHDATKNPDGKTQQRHSMKTEHLANSHSASEHSAIHQEIQMPMKAKPKRFWESKQLPHQVSDHTRHRVEDENFSVAKRLQSAPLDNLGDVQTHTSHDHSQHGSNYVCPMHPQIVSHEADATCPICGMNLVEKIIPAASVSESGVSTTFICPMHPQIIGEEPGSCPICGMDLVPKTSVLKSEQNPQVFLNTAVIQNMGIRTITAKRDSLGKEIKTQGIVAADDEGILNIHPRTGGWVERLYPSSEGDRVERKEELLDFYSPWINQAQLDFITALEELDMVTFDPSRKGELDAKVDALRNTLRLLNVSPMDVMRIEKSRKVLNTVQIMAPQGGLITELNVNEGSYVEPYQSMFTIVDLSEVWVMVDIFEHQAPWIRKGQQVTITTPVIPGRAWTGEVEFIYPEVDPKTRTLRARIEVPNPDEALLLNMFVQVDLSQGAAKENIVSVPRESIILTGEREIIVKSLGKGHFQPVEVQTGIWGSDNVEILSGITEGDEVVVSGQFLIDSESNIQSSLLRMSE